MLPISFCCWDKMSLSKKLGGERNFVCCQFQVPVYGRSEVTAGETRSTKHTTPKEQRRRHSWTLVSARLTFSILTDLRITCPKK